NTTNSGRDPREVTPTPGSKTKWRSLYEPDKPIQPAELRKEIEAPWANAALAPGEPAVLTVGRGAGSRYPSLSAACLAAPPKRPCVLEIHDNGPLFDVPAVLADQSLTIRPGKGFRPLLVWDVGRTLDERRRPTVVDEAQPLVFLDVQRG